MLLPTLFEPTQATRLTPLLNAIERGDVWGVANQVAGGHCLDAIPGLGTSPLIVATSSKQQDVVEWLIEAGADVGARDVLGRNALMYACQVWEQRTAIFDTLVAHTPDLDEKDPEGYTALIHAARSDRPDLVLALLAAGAGLHIRDRYGYTALGHAMRLGHVATFEVMAQAGGAISWHTTTRGLPTGKRPFMRSMKTCCWPGYSRRAWPTWQTPWDGARTRTGESSRVTWSRRDERTTVNRDVKNDSFRQAFVQAGSDILRARRTHDSPDRNPPGQPHHRNHDHA